VRKRLIGKGLPNTPGAKSGKREKKSERDQFQNGKKWDAQRGKAGFAGAVVGNSQYRVARECKFFK